MPETLPYCSPSNIRALTWTLTVGTPLTGYGVDKLSVEDPSDHLWLNGTSIDARCDQGSALQLDGLAVNHHNFVQNTTLRIQMHSDTATWGGTTDVDISLDVGAWMGRWAPHVFFNIAAAVSQATRTRRYIRFTNTDANISNIKIGNLIPTAIVQELSKGVLLAKPPRTSKTFGRSIAEGKKGPQYVHDRRTRDRQWVGALLQGSADRTLFDAWQDDSYGVRPFVVWPLNDIAREPVYARFIEPTDDPTYLTDTITETAFEIKEMSCGEAY